MKKYFFLSALSTICLVQFAIAQVGKGKMLLGGAFGYEKVELPNALKHNNINSPDYSFTPMVGFGLSHNWILGILATYDRTMLCQKAPILQTSWKAICTKAEYLAGNSIH